MPIPIRHNFISCILFLFTNILIWQILFLFTYIFQSIYEYIFLYWIYLKSMNIPHYGFVCPVDFWNEKYIESRKEKKMNFLKEKMDIRYLWIIHKYFPSDKYYSYSYSQVMEFTNYSYSYSYRSWLRESFPIPIRGKSYYSLITGLVCFHHN